MSDVPIPELGSSIISEEAAELLKRAGEGTLGNSEVKVKPVDKKTENIESVDDSKVNRDEGSTLVDVKGDVERKGNGSEDSTAVECLDKDNLYKSPQDIEVNNNAETNENHNDKEGNDISVRADSKSAIEKVDEGEGKDSDSDENEVFYESKSGVSPTERVDVSGIGEQNEESEIVELVSSKENDKVDIKPDVDEKGGSVSEGNEGKVDNDVAVKFSESESIEVNRNVIEKNEDKEFRDSQAKQMLGSRSSLKRLINSESGISLESDVTYHSESEEESFVEAVVDSSDEKIVSEFGDEKVLMRDDDSVVMPVSEPLKENFKVNESGNVAVSSNVEFHLDDEDVCDSCGSPSVENGTDSETKVENLIKGEALVVNTEGAELPAKEDAVSKVSVEVNESQAEVCTSVSHNDEVFMPSPSGKIGNENDMIEFAKNYVSDIVLKSVDMYNKEVKEEKIMVRQQSCTSANIDISIPKRHYSEELAETASAVMPRKLSSGTVEILSPVVNLPSENSGDLKFFSYKVDTEADVVLTSIEEEKNPLEGKVSVDCAQSPVSGFGICYSGVKGHSDIDSDSDSSNEESEDLEGEKEAAIDFISMPVSLDKRNDDSNDMQQIKVDFEDSEVSSERENKKISSEENVPIDKSDEIVEANVDSSNAKVDKTENKDVGQVQNDLEENATELVSKTNEGGNNLDNFYKGIESEVSKMGKNKDEAISDNVTDVEENLSAKVGDSNKVVLEEGATGVDLDEELSRESVDNSPESGSRLSGEISPNEESGHSVDSNSGKSKKKGSKKRGSKKNSKEECLIS